LDPLSRVLVPLDGSERSAWVLKGLPHLLGGALKDLVLLRVVTWPRDVLCDEDAEAFSDIARGEVDPKRDELRRAGFPARTRIEFGGAPGVILRVAEEEDSQLVAMTTHGRTGLERWVLGSVAEKVLRNCRRALLVVRTQKVEH
jgi:nucleotide-binding universal stress UspA family protein